MSDVAKTKVELQLDSNQFQSEQFMVSSCAVSSDFTSVYRNWLQHLAISKKKTL